MLDINITDDLSHPEAGKMDMISMPNQASSSLNRSPYTELPEEQAAQMQGGGYSSRSVPVRVKFIDEFVVTR